MLEEYARFFDLDMKSRDIKEDINSKSSDLSTADDNSSNSSARNKELLGCNICLKVSIDTLQAFTGVRRCLNYNRIQLCADCSGHESSL